LVSDETYAEYNACRREAIGLLAFTRKEFTIPKCSIVGSFGCAGSDMRITGFFTCENKTSSDKYPITLGLYYEPTVIQTYGDRGFKDPKLTWNLILSPPLLFSFLFSHDYTPLLPSSDPVRGALQGFGCSRW
jgi:hypothetical protein